MSEPFSTSVDEAKPSHRSWWREDWLAYLTITFALITGVATAYSLSRVDSLDDDTEILTILLAIDMLAVLVLGTLVVRQIWRLYSERRQRLAGHQLHWRLALLFGGVTTLPAIIITMFALFVVDSSLRGWFAERISTAITGSVQVADSYFEEHASSISSDLLTMANDVNREAFQLAASPKQMSVYLDNQVVLRNLSEAVIFDGTGQLLAKSRFAFAVSFTNMRTDWVERARNGEVVVLRADDTNKLRALVKLTSYVDAYLFVGRFIDKSVLEAVDSTRLAASDYQQIGIRQLDLQVSFAFLFGLVLLLLLIAALWIGLNLANSIVGPLGSVISVAEQVRSGNLSQRVPEHLELDEISKLGSSFNRMLDELHRSREQLVQANTQLDRRREFTEAVLGGVSSGVIGLDQNGKVTLPNAAALSMLGLVDMGLIGKRLDDVVPEFKSLLSVVGKEQRRLTEEQIVLVRGNARLTLRAKVASENVEGRVIGYVVTFDDVTDLLTAQRKAAWSDIARRIAHEIKNPLTPIQLAADRLLRKYKPDDKESAAQYDEYLSIISRQVGDIGRMVDEFSSFARMPQPVLQPVSMRELVSGQVSLFNTEKLSCNVEMDTVDKDNPFMVYGDPGLLRQALTNLIQNARDSMDDAAVNAQKLDLKLGVDDGFVVVSISDNGQGFPEMDLSQLLEPYVTKREKGTGLGLAIVSKVVQDHSGTLVLANAPGGGAVVTIRIPVFETPEGPEGSERPEGTHS